MTERKNVTTLVGKTVTKVESSGTYVLITFDKGQRLQVPADMAYDKNGNRYIDNAPLMK